MSTRTPLRRWAGLAVAMAVAAVTITVPISVTTAPEAHAANPPATLGATLDYFGDVYDDLGADSVFETVTVERFEYILKTKPGNFAFLIGDPTDVSTQATIGDIDAAAKALGVSKIYNFTPKLDGDTLNVWNLSVSGLRTGTSPDPAGGDRTGQGLAQYETLGNRLLTDYLNKDTTPQFTKNASTDPYLFVYNKDRTVGAEQDRIVAALAGAKTEADLDTTPEHDAFRAQVTAVLDSVDTLATNTQFQFLKDEHNRRHYERDVKNADPIIEADNLTRYGGDVLEDSDNADGFRVENITYPELLHLVQQPGDFALLFGGTWCHNTAAIIKDTNRLAQENGIKKVYNFDFSLASTGNSGADALHIRDTAWASGVGGQVIRPSHLYGDLVNNYLTNAITQYRKNGDPGTSGTNFVAYYPGGDTTQPLAEARKIQVGHVLTYNKDRVNALGQDEPVIDQAIRQNDDGGNTEHMTEWWFVKGRDLPAGATALRGAANPASQTGSNQLQSQRAFAKEGIEEIESLFKGFSATNIASTTSVTGVVDGAELPSNAAPTLDVTVSAAGFAPFISLYTPNQNALPPAVPATGKPRGVVALFNGDTKLAEARLTRAGTASFAVPALADGEHALKVRYLGRGDLITPSQWVANVTVGEVAGPVFSDVPAEHPFYADISWLVDNGIAAGYPDNTFKPSSPVTRQAVASFLYKLAESPDFSAPSTPTFDDVPTTHPFYKQIEWLADRNIVAGYPDGTFKPTGVVTRQAVASFLYKFAGSPDFTPPSTPSFDDVSAGHQFRTPIEWLVSKTITVGYPDDTFRPTNAVSRQAAASFLHKYDTNV